MRTFGMLPNGRKLEIEETLTLITGREGCGKTYLATNLILQDFKNGRSVVYISLNEDCEWYRKYLDPHMEEDDYRILSPGQIDFSNLRGDTDLAMSFAAIEAPPEIAKSETDTEPIFMAGKITFIDIGWSHIRNNDVRHYLAGLILQDLAESAEIISLFVDEFNWFQHKIEHPIIQYWLNKRYLPTTFIMQAWDQGVTIPDELKKIPVFVAFSQGEDSWRTGSVFFDGGIEPQTMLRLGGLVAYVKDGQDIFFIEILNNQGSRRCVAEVKSARIDCEHPKKTWFSRFLIHIANTLLKYAE